MNEDKQALRIPELRGLDKKDPAPVKAILDELPKKQPTDFIPRSTK